MSSIETRDLGCAVVEAVAAAEGVEPDELEPTLHEAIDPEALDALFQGRPATTWLVRFEYHGYIVSITDRGEITLERIDTATLRQY